eukprot:354519-Chlamydomonas_euryale.AAC.1
MQLTRAAHATHTCRAKAEVALYPGAAAALDEGAGSGSDGSGSRASDARAAASQRASVGQGCAGGVDTGGDEEAAAGDGIAMGSILGMASAAGSSATAAGAAAVTAAVGAVANGGSAAESEGRTDAATASPAVAGATKSVSVLVGLAAPMVGTPPADAAAAAPAPTLGGAAAATAADANAAAAAAVAASAAAARARAARASALALTPGDWLRRGLLAERLSNRPHALAAYECAATLQTRPGPDPSTGAGKRAGGYEGRGAGMASLWATPQSSADASGLGLGDERGGEPGDARQRWRRRARAL